MLFALQDEHGFYIHRSSKLAGSSYIQVRYTANIKFARLWDEINPQIKSAKTRVNKAEIKQEELKANNKLTGRYTDGFSGYDYDTHQSRLITKVDIVEIELIKKEVKDNG